jgi:hypothetical protein
MATEPHENGYLVWRRFAELSGDRPMVARLHIIHRARQAGFKLTVPQPDGTELRFPEMIAAEAAAAALNTPTEGDWHLQWTRLLVNTAVRWQDPATTEGVVSVLNTTDTVISDLKIAGVWPWGSEEEEENA